MMSVFDGSWEYAVDCGYDCSWEGYKCTETRETFFMESLDEGDYWLMLHPFWNINGAHYVVEAYCETDADWDTLVGISNIAVPMTIMINIILMVTIVLMSS